MLKKQPVFDNGDGFTNTGDTINYVIKVTTMVYLSPL